ncbi:MAG: hypothetical protein D6814_12835, partial [Calditrichaeota bacterium]
MEFASCKLPLQEAFLYVAELATIRIGFFYMPNGQQFGLAEARNPNSFEFGYNPKIYCSRFGNNSDWLF